MIKDRIAQLLKSKKIAKEKFYLQIGMTSASFRGNAKNTPLNSTAIENIISIIPDVNAGWLLTGKGEMLKTECDEQPSAEDRLLSLIESQQRMLESQQRIIEELTHKVKSK